MFKKTSQRHRLFKLLPFGILIASGNAQTAYQFGNPTAEEQSYIELINRARANPPAEGARLAATTAPDVLSAYSQYGVDLVMMQNEFNAIAAAQPLAPNASLTTAARGHSLWMLNNATQSHYETNPSNDPEQRIEDAGYNWSNYGENVFAYSNNVGFGHAGFQVDWGTGGTGGMQSPRGHRNSIHNSIFREIGVGVTNGRNGSVGPQLVTQNLGAPYVGQSFATGVAYYDLNSNDFYDVGEGIAGLTVNVAGSTTYCTTAIGGGWTVPIPGAAATRSTTFVGLGIDQTRSLVVPASLNSKVDLKLTYTVPAITSPATATANAVHNFAFTSVGGATGYKWNCWNITTVAPENCNTLADVTISTTAAYSVLNTAIKQEGTGSFHLANPSLSTGSQIVELKTLFHGQTSPSLAFQSRLRNSTSSEHHKVQVKEEGSAVWLDVADQLGGAPETVFSLRTVNLAAMAGKKFRVRFNLSFTSGGSSYGSSENNFGWFIDAISFTNLTSLVNNVSQSLAGTSGSFTPAAGNYLMSVTPVISGLEFPNTDQALTVSAAAPSFGTWAASIESSNSLAAGAISNYPNADLDNDGRANLLEYAFGTSPVNGNEAAPRIPAMQPGAGDLVIRYVRDTALTDIALVPVAGSDLSAWRSPGQPGAPSGFTDSLVSTAGNLETREAKIPYSSGANWFIRVKVNKL